MFGFTAGNAAEIARFFVGDGEMLESLCVSSPIEVVRQRDGGILAGPGIFIQHHDAIGFRVR